MTAMIHAPVLVLNQNYQPLNICNVRRAMVLVGLGKAEPMANGRGDIRTVSARFAVPSVIRLVYMVKQPIIRRRLSRRAIFYRDDFACQYCGAGGKTLTLDHIVPRSRGGAHEWDNVVSACVQCNHRKAGLTPSEARMRLRRRPSAPKPEPYALFRHRPILDEWREFIPWVS